MRKFKDGDAPLIAELQSLVTCVPEAGMITSSEVWSYFSITRHRKRNDPELRDIGSSGAVELSLKSIRINVCNICYEITSVVLCCNAVTSNGEESTKTFGYCLRVGFVAVIANHVHIKHAFNLLVRRYGFRYICLATYQPCFFEVKSYKFNSVLEIVR